MILEMGCGGGVGFDYLLLHFLLLLLHDYYDYDHEERKRDNPPDAAVELIVEDRKVKRG